MLQIPNTMIVPPGSTVNIGGPQTNTLLKFLDIPSNSLSAGVPDIPTETINAEESVNGNINYAYPLYPYADETHKYIQPGMLTFVSRYIDPKYKIYNMVPVFKMNIMQSEAMKEFNASNNPKVQEFKRLLAEYGERVLDEYHAGRYKGDNADMINFYKLAKSPEFKYVTKFGILNSWNFAGAVLSKGESTGPGVFMDHHSSTDIVFVASLVVGKQARISNIWGKASPGDRLCLILTKKGNNGPFIWVPYNHSGREYPPRNLTKYRDASDRQCDSFVQKVGTVTEANERDTLLSQTEMALGYFNDNVKDAYEANGSLSNLIVQIRI